jgi:hypothetical protein
MKSADFMSTPPTSLPIHTSSWLAWWRKEVMLNY